MSYIFSKMAIFLFSTCEKQLLFFDFIGGGGGANSLLMDVSIWMFEQQKEDIQII